MKRSVLTFGIMSGVVIFAYTYILVLIFGDFSNVNPRDLEMMAWLGYLRYLILLLGVVMAMVTYRRETQGPISYGRSFKVGLLSAVIIALFVGVMEYVYVAFTDPDFYDNYGRVMIEGLKARGAAATEIEKMRQEIESHAWMKNPVNNGLFYFCETAVLGTIISLIAALFIRRKDGTASLEGPGSVLNQPA